MYLDLNSACQTFYSCFKVSKGAKIRNRYNQVPHLTQDTNGKVTNSQLDTTNKSQEGSPFPAGDHKAHINRRTQRHSTHNTQKTHKSVRIIKTSQLRLLAEVWCHNEHSNAM